MEETCCGVLVLKMLAGGFCYCRTGLNQLFPVLVLSCAVFHFSRQIFHVASASPSFSARKENKRLSLRHKIFRPFHSLHMKISRHRNSTDKLTTSSWFSLFPSLYLEKHSAGLRQFYLLRHTRHCKFKQGSTNTTGQSVGLL